MIAEINTFEDILKFLDLAARTTREHANALSAIDDKVVYHRHADQLALARSVLRKEIFCYEDYVETGKYEVPEIKYTSITMPAKITRHNRGPSKAEPVQGGNPAPRP